MALVDVRRLAAVDMWGTAGTRFRRRIILAEFVAGAVLGVALGIVVMATAGGTGWTLFGAYLVGICLNYVPLALHAIELYPAGRLEGELAGVDVRGELRTYTVRQFWIFVPLLLVVLELRRLRREGARGR
jgi:hypothetical protein